MIFQYRLLLPDLDSSWFLYSLLVGTLLSCAGTGSLQAQNVSVDEFGRWAGRNGFQAGQNWRSYLAIEPGSLGPNGLPVMPSLRGRVDSVASFSVSSNLHTAPGDQAVDISLEGRYSFGSRASLRVRYIAVEWFEMSRQLALERNVLSDSLSGVAFGDVYVDGLFQVIKGHRSLPDATLAVRVKTASGTDLESMRFSDTPGYAFSASFGKNLPLAGASNELRLYGSGGFYVWQRFNIQTPQNDAYTYSLGAELHNRYVVAFAEWAGYSGWADRLDQPMVVRGGVHTVGPLSAGLLLSQGLRHYPYFSLGVSLTYQWR